VQFARDVLECRIMLDADGKVMFLNVR